MSSRRPTQSQSVAPPRRTQAERRAGTQAQVLASACRIFGEKGYANTSLEEIAADCGLTIRPVYHYYGNKRELFAAANAHMEQKIVDALTASAADGDFLAGWQAFLGLCDDAGFRRIVLIDSPNILGRDRWINNDVMNTAATLLSRSVAKNAQQKELIIRMALGAMAEAALMIAAAENPATLRRHATVLIKGLLEKFGS
jgi:AcrR family transcriptional regulator